MADWYPIIYKACIYASVVAFVLAFFTSDATSLGAYLAGYSALTLGILMVLIILFTKTLKINNNNSSLQTLYLILITSGPFILMLGVISFILYLLIKYKNNITEGHIAPSYNSFNNITVMLILLQLYLVINAINNERFETTGKMSKVITSTIYLLGVLTTISSIILYTILKYYSTDGFMANLL